jgi:serine/threonine protein kinase
MNIGLLKLIDFGCATRIVEETQTPTTSPHQLKQTYGTLAYISPEQTGR